MHPEIVVSEFRNTYVCGVYRTEYAGSYLVKFHRDSQLIFLSYIAQITH
jgi:hypothetical protein